jgi:hypothetical protein
MTDTDHPDPEQQLAALRQARLEADASRARLDRLICSTAEDRGRLTIDRIAEAAGLSRQRIYQLLAEQ